MDANYVARKRMEAMEAAGEEFDRLDPQSKGYVDVETVAALMQEIAPGAQNLDMKEARQFIFQFDTKGDQTVTRDEFCEWYGL